MLSTLPIERRGLTEFTYSRFLVPWLCGYQGRAAFYDADMLCLGDVAELHAALSADCDIAVVKNPLRFEWPSLILFDNARCRILTPDFVSDPANEMMDLGWAKDIGSLPPEWNHCIGYDAPRRDAKLVHFTQGIPFHAETDGTEYVEEWRAELEASVHSESWEALMGNSVHAKHVRARMATRAAA